MKMIPWDGIGCYFSGIALYCLGITICKDAEILKSVTRVNQLKELEQLLDTQNSALVVAISGKVASESTIECELSGLKGVIVEEAVEQHFLKHKHNDSWIKDSALTSFTSKEIPWYLEDSTDRVDVVGAQSAKDFVLPVKHEVFKPSNPRLISKALHYIRGLKELGFNRTERTLPIGTTVTVVGEMMLAPFGFNNPAQDHFMSLPKQLISL
ncbi:E3 ubiquitin-protein ligase SP1 [Medicago truncatula]|uniref:E3 ubiquitin-protein ligase SP1 n=1 Tax=Medicago truncatula TaxID=3880 RepID=UPI0019679DDE|nr:E3 ubiquitin-protein ligase SP1 [Medicago truncatula]